jgi:hypothetical protein
MKITFIAFSLFGCCIIASALEVSIPNVESLGQNPATLKTSLLTGETNSIHPSHLELDLNDDGTLSEIRASYEKSVLPEAMKSTLEQQFGLPTKKFTKESGDYLYIWRNEAKRFAVMYSPKSVEDEKPFVLVHNLGKVPKSKK